MKKTILLLTFIIVLSVSVFADCPATGGTKSTFGDYCIHAFTSSGTFSVPDGISLSSTVLVVGGGGGGGRSINSAGAGGGGGGIVYKTNYIVSGSYTVTRGAGGARGTQNTAGSNGGDSRFGTLVAKGGGRGTGSSGGSGGGGRGSHTWRDTGGSATQPSQSSGGFGNAGGSGYMHQNMGARGGGGGGGAGGAGGNGASRAGGNGGNGRCYGTVFGTNFGSGGCFAGGGGGSNPPRATGDTTPLGTVGSGRHGGGNGRRCSGTCNGYDGQANTGSGGGGTSTGQGVENFGGGNGGSGIVLVRYLKTSIPRSITFNLEEDYNIVDNNNSILESGISLIDFMSYLRIRKNNIDVVEFQINNHVNLNGVTVEMEGPKTVVSGLSSAPGVTGTFNMYVERLSRSGWVYICPNVNTIDDLSEECADVVYLLCDGETYDGYSCSVEGSFYKISGLTGTGGGEGEGTFGDGEEVIPEFSTIGIILAVMIIGIFSMFIIKKKK
jgi:hypothetical protein